MFFGVGRIGLFGGCFFVCFFVCLFFEITEIMHIFYLISCCSFFPLLKKETDGLSWYSTNKTSTKKVAVFCRPYGTFSVAL